MLALLAATTVGCTGPAIHRSFDEDAGSETVPDGGGDGATVLQPDADGGAACGRCGDGRCEGTACVCSRGFELSDDGCIDVDECASDRACGWGGTCHNLHGSFACTCSDGFKLGGDGTCVDIDECASNDRCAPGVCRNLLGSFECMCPEGYASTPAGECVDVDECAANNGACGLATCVDHDGTFSCGDCPAGFGGTPPDCAWNDPYLADLSIEGATFAPSFASGFTNYFVQLGRFESQTVLTPTLPPQGVGRATISLGEQMIASGIASAPFSLGLGETQIRIVVRAESGSTRDYDLLIRRGWTHDGAIRTTIPNVLYRHPIALSGDGNVLVVGAPYDRSASRVVNGDENDTSASWAGAVFVYRREASGWVREAYLKASNADANDRFGDSVAISADGSTLVVGAYGESGKGTTVNSSFMEDNSIPYAGAAYVFERSEQSWAQTAYLKASNNTWGGQPFGTPVSPYFGMSVAVSGDGSTVVVGAPYEAGVGPGVNGSQVQQFFGNSSGSGAAFVFGRQDASWTQQAYVKSMVIAGARRFGWSVALSGDGSTLAVGEPLGGGKANVYARAGSTWSFREALTASNGRVEDHFGKVVALSSDGSTLAVSALYEDSSVTGIWSAPIPMSDRGAERSGAVYLFEADGSTWSRRTYIKASNTHAQAEFGSSLALSGDGSTLAVGAPHEIGAAMLGGPQIPSSLTNAGAVYLARRTAGTWSQLSYVKSPNTQSEQRFGMAAALSFDGSTLVVNGSERDETSNLRVSLSVYE
jgi:hypothetical protein